MTHICIGNLTNIGPDKGLSSGRRQAIIWTNAGIFLIVPWGINFSEIVLGIQTFSFKKMHLKMSAEWRPFCLGLNVLTFGNIPNITSHERHDISCYSKLFGDKTLSSYKKNLNALYYSAFERGICQWPVNSTHKRPVMRKAFSYYEIIATDSFLILSTHE